MSQDLVDDLRIMVLHKIPSSTHRPRKVRSLSERQIYTHGSAVESVKQMLVRIPSSSMFQSLDDCLRPYKAF